MSKIYRGGRERYKIADMFLVSDFFFRFTVSAHYNICLTASVFIWRCKNSGSLVAALLELQAYLVHREQFVANEQDINHPIILQHNGLWIAFGDLHTQRTPSRFASSPPFVHIGQECFGPWLTTPTHAQIIRHRKAH